MKELPPVPDGFGLLDNQQWERLRKKGLLYTPDNCVTCRGERSFKWRDLDPKKGDEIVEYRCDCPGQWQMWAWFASMGIELRHQRLLWTDLVAIDGRAMDVADEYLANQDYNLRNGHGLFLYGEVGRGKSSLAYLITKTLISRGVKAYATSFEDLIKIYSSTFDSHENKEWFVQNVRNAGILLIDGLGRDSTEKARLFQEQVLDSIFKHRVESALPTILCSTHDPDWVIERYGPGMEWLLEEATTTVELAGNNFFYDQRRTQRAEFERMNGLTRPVAVG